MSLTIDVKPFTFLLMKPLLTSQGILTRKQGWLLHLANKANKSGWGEVSPLNTVELKICKELLKSIKKITSREELEEGIKIWPKALSFGVGAALAELDDQVGCQSSMDWLPAPESAILLPATKNLLLEVDAILEKPKWQKTPITLKLKVAIEQESAERKLISQVLEHLPETGRLRLDANGGWNRKEAQNWVNQMLHEPRLDWLEQPLEAKDLEGLQALAKQVPVALDESLIENPSLNKCWPGWQIRRPSLEGDPRPLLKELQQGVGYRALSTAFETGIGRRWVKHLAGLQQQGPTPTAPGLAPGWCPNSELFSNDPNLVWEAA